MKYLTLAFLLQAALLLAQSPKQVLPQNLPVDRVADTYGVYDAALHNPIWDHTDDAEAYFISDHTGHTYGVSDADKCVEVPEEDQRTFGEAVSDFRAQKGKVYRLENYFNFKQRKLRLLTPKEEKAILEKLFRRRGNYLLDPMLNKATDVIRLRNVGLSNDRLLAIVVVSNYCGGLCGGEKWRIFKGVEKEWVEQQWNSCEIVSKVSADVTGDKSPSPH